ncbi:MAG: ABC transporter related protein [candidate division WS6 bacterium GW2011_GWF1_35_23]|uniref:ABC transporter related protein n=1 Tax=candidate division WS6 bacterium GW2011_GWF1_35_23 TaxID=1619097 RepID=A0A0G0C9P3_9BACT|nr:MAG: ABC transporter related protein [candidate division WS6 bacterium GW2011_GWF1_35_23]
MKNAVEVENLSKRYTIGQREKYLTLRDMMVKAVKVPGNLARGKKFAKKEEFWALKDVNFTVKEGEVVGIIGRNGAGKSTLLKILSRITEPTHGIIKLNGRVSSLLEVGTGFHPELTGRENIYLNGAIMGMKKREIEKKFDEIVEFSGVEKFLDMPVKRYSSGMQVRLAFSVAAHLEPDILIIDEVLAVGDAEFQKKCLGKMDEVTKEAGRTILFVSHDMGAVQRLCKKTILLEEGKIVMYDETEKVINRYLSKNESETDRIDLSNYSGRKGSKDWFIKSVRLEDSKKNISRAFTIGEDIRIVFEVDSLLRDKEFTASIVITREDGLKIANMLDRDSDFTFKGKLDAKLVSVNLKDIRLYPASYYISIWLGSYDGNDNYDYAEHCVQFEIIGGGKYSPRKLPVSDGTIFLNPEWTYEH